MSGPAGALTALERLLSSRYGAHGVRLVDSGTHAVEAALRVAAHLADEPVIVALPAYTCFDVATAAVGADARIALYDVNPGTLGPDLESLDMALVGGARVVVVSPLYGIPVNWDEID